MATRRNPANPGLFGQDVASLGWKALGLVSSGALADKFAWPLVQRFAPGQGVVSQVAHGLTTFATAVLLGRGVGMMGQRSIGNDLAQGGSILGVGEMIGSVVPGFTVSGTFPTALPLRPTVPMLPPPNGVTTNAPAIAAPGQGARVYSGI